MRDQCRRGRELLRRLADDPRAIAERARLELHLAECARCAGHVRAARLLAGAAARLVPPPLAPAAATALEERLRSAIRLGLAARAPAVPLRRAAVARRLALAASLAVLVGGSALWVFFRHGGEGGESAGPPAGPVAGTIARVPHANVEAARVVRVTGPGTGELVPGAALGPGVEADVEAGGELVLHFANDTMVSVHGPGRAVMARTGRGIILRRGVAAVHAARSRPGEGFVVAAPGWRVEVVGTRFVVDAGGAGVVVVLEGTVAVVTEVAAAQWIVRAGQRLVPLDPQAGPRALSPEEREHAAALLPAAGEAARAGAPDPEPRVEAPPAVPPEPAPDQGGEAKATGTVEQPGGTGGASAVEVARRAMQAGRVQDAIDALAQKAARGRLQRDGLELLADAYAAAGRIDEAVGAYRRVARESPRTAAAENALYAAARLLLERAGRAREALEIVEDLRREHGKGMLAQETTIAYFEALLRVDDPRAATALDDYLSRYPNGYRAADALFLLGALRQAAGNCEAAVPLYRRLLELQPAGPRARDVQRRMDACGRMTAPHAGGGR